MIYMYMAVRSQGSCGSLHVYIYIYIYIYIVYIYIYIYIYVYKYYTNLRANLQCTCAEFILFKIQPLLHIYVHFIFMHMYNVYMYIVYIHVYAGTYTTHRRSGIN